LRLRTYEMFFTSSLSSLCLEIIGRYVVNSDLPQGRYVVYKHC
jgi:hypothetical protein